jgi:predicted lipid-binding transport protein (Tim44 family)
MTPPFQRNRVSGHAGAVHTFYFFALMLLVWTVWALIGFGYPSAPGPIVLNIVSKLLAFATALSLFWPQRTRQNNQAKEIPAAEASINAAGGSASGAAAQGPMPRS